VSSDTSIEHCRPVSYTSVYLLAWLKAFLTNSTQAVKICNCILSSISITSGVPQSSVLGLLLFLFYINDITDIAAGLDVNLKLFADDAKL